MEPSPSSRARVIDVLRSSSVFGALQTEIIEALADAMTLKSVHGGETVIHEGAASDCIIFVISGGLRVSRQGTDGQLLLYNQIQPGQSIGELGMILGQARAQDVTAVRDSRLALLSRQAYERLLQCFPLELSQVFLKAVYDRMRNAPDPADRHLAQTFVLLPLQHQQQHGQQTSLGQDLTLAFAKHGRVAHLQAAADGSKLLLNGQAVPREALPRIEEEHEFILYESSGEDCAWTRYAFRQADQVVFVADAEADPRLADIELTLCLEPGYLLKRRHLVLLHSPAQVQAVPPAPWLLGRDVERIYPLRRGRLGDSARLARFLTGSAVGIVLGGGGARGFAHLGVLRALQECGLAVDLIGGNSMGALIGAQYALGHDLADILRHTQRFAAGGERPTLPLVSLAAGRRVERDLKRMFGSAQIEQLWRPYFAAACNLSLGNTQVLDAGPLWKAVLASNSPAGLLPPVLMRGALLVDGAILDNVPVQAMRMRLGTKLERRRGNGLIIAIDVDVRANLLADHALKRLSAWSTLKSKFSTRAPVSPGIAEILYSASHVGSMNQRVRTIAQADHYLEPPVGEYALMAYGRGADIAEVGYRYAMEKIGQWDLPKQSDQPRA
ncbi:patatin-like phospholipase family protein [Paucibacter sp. TC2R-5]|uniref:cyclic nucleotide-binding and patatin-like phospholipase domain-containing protein n=1 Tax=Paucibacter sp. TC2R-5 TaxID=2893555 RepID=UPI0021E4401B|nr:cyclic nucleotide-binding and patatin-like phospholipase domain-containing protein [Paucibacter sp. TC2R-5]MCV2358792.1 patatin-like phospholipase family protein [Paucibacter sp. TC2R-5]